jgi:hypothetical protein
VPGARIGLWGRGALKTLALDDVLDAAGEERARVSAHAWIKELRGLSVDGQPLRRRFTFRGDSLWWFAELYLHKTDVIRDLFRTTAALEQLIERERPLEMSVTSGHWLVRSLAPQVARAHHIRYRGPSRGGAAVRLAKLNLRARALTYAALASRLRRRPRPDPCRAADIVAFVHRAFWRGDAGEGSAESYIGPVLAAIERRLAPGALRYVALGPTRNFGARRWWDPLLKEGPPPGVIPVETCAPWAALRESRRVWRERHAMRRALWASEDVRRHAVVNGIDWWAIVREELAGVALLQWPWSARAMDEAAAALDVLRPRVALTYAEAGGWGRALMLECRRRGVASVGLQHGFIYRHWLNYLHEPDEMEPDPGASADRGFPRPDLTLLFDGYAARHLERAGGFPPESLCVTGSPRLDALIAAARALTPDAVEAARHDAGATDRQALVLLVTKFREARQVLPALLEAAAGMPDVQVVIKTHPAETPDAYEPLARGRHNIRVLPASAPLAPLLAAARAIVTLNSTVAVDGAVLGVPTLVIGLPSNLTPLVDEGAMAGARSEDIGPALRRILYDEEFRREIEAKRSVFLARFGIGSDGGAAERSAQATLRLLGHIGKD